MFGALAMVTLWTVWPSAPCCSLLLLVTRGRRRLSAPAAGAVTPRAAASGDRPRRGPARLSRPLRQRLTASRARRPAMRGPGRPGNRGWSGNGEARMPQVTLTVNGKTQHGRGRGPHAAGGVAAREAAPDRHPCRLRHQPVRRLRGACRRRSRSSPAPCWRVQAEGAKVTTIEGLADADGTLHPMQEAFREHHALQCGFCTPGMVMSRHRPGEEAPRRA